MQGTYAISHVCGIYNITALLVIQLIVYAMLFTMINILHFYISTF
jgi:hypothetical protein